MRARIPPRPGREKGVNLYRRSKTGWIPARRVPSQSATRWDEASTLQHQNVSDRVQERHSVFGSGDLRAATFAGVCTHFFFFFRLTAIWDEWCWMVGSSRYTVSSVCVSFCIGVCVFCLLVFNIFLSFAATGQQMAGGGRWQRISLQYIASWTWIPWWFFFALNLDDGLQRLFSL